MPLPRPLYPPRQLRPLPLFRSTGPCLLSYQYTRQNSTSTTAHPYESTIETLLPKAPCLQCLRQNSAYREFRPHLSLPAATRQSNLVSGPLTGPGRISVPPYVFTRIRNESATAIDSDSNTDKTTQADVITIFHVGAQVSGHPGFMQGGLMAVMFDEAFARCASPAFRSGVGMTVNMALDFRSPARLDRVYVMETGLARAEGRKAWVTGVLKDAGPAGTDTETATMVAEARALFVEPRFAQSMEPLYKN